MAKKSGRDIQLSFDFNDPDTEVKFISVMGECRCGYTAEFRKADVVLEMTVPCPQCRSLISIK